ncbi:histidine kinase [Nonomuraea sp. NBC_00507]|uniref:histidine kinase n=1 Tax=Nonomuraea sp. NBC_00507 TaxID=2976002 RepID=UPI003FA57C4B
MVEHERLRFADRHDVLGHRLSVMTLKSQLADRLIAAVPDRTRREIEQVEALSRQALDDVRDTMAGYRALSPPEERPLAGLPAQGGSRLSRSSPRPARGHRQGRHSDGSDEDAARGLRPSSCSPDRA